MVIPVQYKGSEGNKYLNQETSITPFKMLPFVAFEYACSHFKVAYRQCIQRVPSTDSYGDLAVNDSCCYLADIQGNGSDAHMACPPLGEPVLG